MVGLICISMNPMLKDYISVQDVAKACILLSVHPDSFREIINVAAGYNITAGEIAEVIKSNVECEVIWHDISFQKKFSQ